MKFILAMFVLCAVLACSLVSAEAKPGLPYSYGSYGPIGGYGSYGGYGYQPSYGSYGSYGYGPF